MEHAWDPVHSYRPSGIIEFHCRRCGKTRREHNRDMRRMGVTGPLPKVAQGKSTTSEKLAIGAAGIGSAWFFLFILLPLAVVFAVVGVSCAVAVGS